MNPEDPMPLRLRPPALRFAAVCVVVVVLVVVWGGGGAPAAAQVPVIDPAHIALNAAWHYLHYLQFALQIHQQVQQIENQVRALAKLRDPQWREIQSLLTELDFLMRSGSSLGYPLADVGGQYRQLYPGWAPWSDPAVPQRQAERALDTLRAGLAATSQQGQSFAAGEELLGRIRQQMTSTDGHQQALEQIATLAAFSAQEQLLSRQAQAIANNQMAVAQGYWLNRQAQGEANFTIAMVETSLAADRNTSRGWSFRPAWEVP
jgi:P-type conjugative transfer protein TrbJ